MSFAEKWKRFWNPSLALAFDRDTLWSVGGPAEEPRRTETCVALDERTRKVVATPGGEIHKRAIKDAVIFAGAREVITIPRVMAAAIGAGLDVQDVVGTLVYVDREWWSAAVIGRNAILAACESFDAPEHLTVERAWRDREEGRETARSFDAQLEILWREGVENDEACARWVRRMGEHQRVMSATLSKADAHAAQRGPIQPGFRD